MDYLILSMNPGFDRWHIVYNPPKLPRVCRADKVLDTVSGKGVNVARVFTNLGFENYLTLNIEGGRLGKLISSACEKEGIKLKNFEIEGENRINTTIIKEYEKNTMTYNEPGPSLRPEETAGFLEAVRQTLEENPEASLIISGAAPDGFSLEAFLKMLDFAREGGHTIMADIGGVLLPETVKGSIGLLKINREEFSLAFGFDGYDDTARLREFMLEKKISSVVLTDGSAGAIALEGDEIVRCTLEKGCGGPWAVGSGDAFFGGYLYSLSRGKSLAERMSFANACGIANTFVYGPCTFEAKNVGEFERFVHISAE